MQQPLYRAIGLMSGTSIDGIDVACLETNGMDYVKVLGFLSVPYHADFREKLRKCFGNRLGIKASYVAGVGEELTHLHALAVRDFLKTHNRGAGDIDIIGFHGQTIWHNPSMRETVQIGDGGLLSQLTQIPVINDFRTADMRAGGQGAPLVPLYHHALASGLNKPVMIVNIGGVSNMTWIGAGRDDIIACDLGPGNAPIDDWMMGFGKTHDAGGACAGRGVVRADMVDGFMKNEFFKLPAPKSLDRDNFKIADMGGLVLEDGAATLTMITARAIVAGIKLVPAPPTHIYVAGGGRLNKTLMGWIAELAQIPVASVDDLGWSGDGLEAEAFAYLAVRSKLGLPISLPTTTGVPTPMTGGVIWGA